MAEAGRQEVFKRDTTGTSYVKFSSAAVARSLEIEENGERFIADYDASGAVRGVEFLGGRTNAVEYYRSAAARKGAGAKSGGPREKRLG